MTSAELNAITTSVPKEIYLRVEPKGWFAHFQQPRYLNLTQMLYTMSNEDITATVSQTPGLFLRHQISRADQFHFDNRNRARRILRSIYGSKRRDLPSVWYDAAVLGCLAMGAVSYALA